MDGGYVLVATTMSNNGDVSGLHLGADLSADIWVVKLFGNGDVEWQRPLGSNELETGASLARTLDNGYILLGSTSGWNNGDVNGLHHGDAWVVKLDELGTIEWEHAIGGGTACCGGSTGSTIRQTLDGGYILVGTTSATSGDVSGNHGMEDMWVVKLSVMGGIQWQICLGGSELDRGVDIQQTSDGGYAVLGYSRSIDGQVTGNHGSWDFWFVKLDEAGLVQWERSYGGSQTDSAWEIEQTADGGFLLLGLTNSNDGDVSGAHGASDAWVLKTDANGNIVWQEAMGGSSNDGFQSAIEVSDGGFVLAGLSSSNNGQVSGNHGEADGWLVGLDVSGNFLWQESMGDAGIDVFRELSQTDDGGLILIGDTRSNSGDVTGNHGGVDVWIAKMTLTENCSSSLSPNEIQIPPPGGLYSLELSIAATCAWDVTNIPSWILWSGPSLGSGPMTFNYTVEPNDLPAPRTIDIQIAGQSFTVTQAGAAVTSLELKVYTNPGGSMDLADKLLGTSLSGSSSTIPVKICADGTKSTILRVTVTSGSIAMDNLRFRMASSSPDIARYGEFNDADRQVLSATQCTTRFTHPDYLANADGLYRDDVVEVFDMADPGTVLLDIPVRIYRAPMSFVHGLWGGYTSLAHMQLWFEDQFDYENIVSHTAQYDETHDRRFADNSHVLPDEIRRTLNLSYALNYSAGAVDIVAHSMGGVLARLYIQDPAYADDVHTLTTMNTPHSGTQGANMLLSDYGGAARELLAEVNGWHCDRGAVDDLRYDSEPIGEMNSFSGPWTVPTLTYGSTSDPLDLYEFLDWVLVRVVWAANQNPILYPQMQYLGINSPAELAYEIFGSVQHDAVVPLSSQMGGNVGPVASQVTHTQAPRYQPQWTVIKDQLGTDPSLGLFDHDGYDHIPLTMPSWVNMPREPFGGIFNLMPAPVDSIESTSTVWDGSVSPGSTIDFHVAWSGDSSRRVGCLFLQNGEMLLGLDTIGSALDLQYVVPPSLWGKVRVIAFSFGDDGALIFDTDSFTVSGAPVLDSLGTVNELDTFVVELGTSQSYHLVGYHSSGSVVLLGSDDEVTYVINDTAILSHLSGSLFHGDEVGTTFMTASYGGASVEVPIRVIQSSPPLYASFTTPSTNLCGPSTVQFESHFSVAPNGVLWSFPGGSPASSVEPTPVVSYAESGSFDVGLVTTWPDHVDTIYMVDFLTVSDLPSVSIEGELLICTGDQVDLSAVSQQEIDHILWSTSDTAQVIQVGFAGPLGVMVVDVNGCTAIDTVQVSMVDSSDAGLGTDTALCDLSPASFELFDLLEGSPDQGGAWTDPDGNAHSGTFDLVIDSSGVYTYSVIGAGTCLDASATVTVSLFGSPDAGASGTLAICSTSEPTELIISLSGDPDADGVWMSPGGGAHSGIFDPVVDSAGVYTYTVAGQFCPDASSSVDVTSYQAPDAGLSAALVICGNAEPTDLYTVLEGTPAHNGVWSSNGAAHSGVFDPSVDSSSVYTYTVAGQPPCPDATANIMVTENQAPIVTITDLGGTLIATPADASYQWLDCGTDTLPILDATSQTYVPLVNGNYAVVVSEELCTTISSCFLFTTTQLDEGFRSGISVSPNPTTGDIIVRLAGPMPRVTVEVTDVTGRSVLVKEFNNVQHMPISLTGPTGVYQLKVFNDDTMQAFKLLKH
jgi:hypothetical protein